VFELADGRPPAACGGWPRHLQGMTIPARVTAAAPAWRVRPAMVPVVSWFLLSFGNGGRRGHDRSWRGPDSKSDGRSEYDHKLMSGLGSRRVMVASSRSFDQQAGGD
jgi:hypothetical protein